MGDDKAIENGDATSRVPVMEEVHVDALVDRCLTLLTECQNENHNASNACSGFNCYQQVFVGIAGTPGTSCFV